MNLPIEQAIEELKNMPGFAFSQVLTIAKVKTKDGRDAVIRVEITTDEDAVEDADAAIWTPNVKVTGSPVLSASPRGLPGSAAD